MFINKKFNRFDHLKSIDKYLATLIELKDNADLAYTRRWSLTNLKMKWAMAQISLNQQQIVFASLC